MKRYIKSDRASYTTSDGVTWTGFDPLDNGKCIIDTNSRGWTYINYQDNEWSQSIFGYVVANERGSNHWKYLSREDQSITGYYAFTVSDELPLDLGGTRGARMFTDWQAAVDYMINRCKQKFDVREVVYAD